MKPAPQPFLPLPGLGVYGDLPGHALHSETSRAAAEGIAPRLTALQAEVLASIRSTGERGATTAELVAALGWKRNTVAPRVTELAHARAIFKGERRNGEQAWRARP